jgi:peptide-methionine (S)-S-oxide reductase
LEHKATFGAGCFWGVEAAFRRIEGVTATTVGYAGGAVPNPSYEQVCAHETGHAEVVEVTYDPERVPYEQLLTVFWAEQDPTELNRQGPDIGDQYRSVIFVHDEAQRSAAEASRDRVSARLSRPVVTQIEDAPAFWPAEDYHQQYLEQRGLARCHVSLAGAGVQV